MSNESTQDDALSHISQRSTERESPEKSLELAKTQEIDDIVQEPTTEDSEPLLGPPVEQANKSSVKNEHEKEDVVSVKSVIPVPPPPAVPEQENVVARVIEEPGEGNNDRRGIRTSIATDFHDLVKNKPLKIVDGKSGKSRKVLAWKNVQVSTEKSDGKLKWILSKVIGKKQDEEDGKVILNGVSGQAHSGELTFIMGPSGAGKTTLLNALTGRNNKSGLEVDGEVLLNGRPLTQSDLKKLSAYIQQEDVFLSSQTVSEELHFAVQMRSQPLLPRAKRDALVEQMLQTFGLKECEHTRIGSLTNKGISRGEKKRLAFACEILTDPPILFCDEPTTGLDSFMSHQVMMCLKKLASEEGKIVVCTIHQPSTWVYQMADRLVLLCQGHVAFEGGANEVAGFLEKIGSPAPEFASISDHFIRVLSRSTILSHRKLSDSITPKNQSDRHKPKGTMIYRSWCFQFCHLAHRGLVQIARRRMYIIGRFVLTVLVAWILGMIYLQVPIDKDHLLGVKGVIFAALQMNNILYMMPSLISFWEDYHVVIRECQSNMYSPSAYFIARSLTDSILHLIFPIVFFNIIYFLTGLPITVVALATFFTMCIAMAMIITSLSHAVVSLCGNVNISLAIAPLISIPATVFGGFLITVDAVPWYYKPLGYMSWYHYAFEAIIIAIFEDHGEIKGCSKPGALLLPKRFDFECSNGLKFIHDQDFKVDNYWWDFGAIGLILLFWKLLGLGAFVWRIRRATCTLNVYFQ